MKPKTKIAKIADLLPESLSKDTVDRIAILVNEQITEAVNEQVNLLSTKVAALIRMKIDDLKEHAVKELELENDNFRDIELMKHIKGLMAIEVGAADSNYAARTVMEEANSIAEDMQVVNEQLNVVLKENSDLEKTVEILDAKVRELSQKNKLLEAKSLSVKKEESAAALIVDGLKNHGKAIVSPKLSKQDSSVSEKELHGNRKGGSNPLIDENFLRIANLI